MLKFNFFCLLIIAVLTFTANAQTAAVTTDDSSRIPKGPNAIQKMPAFPGGMESYHSFLKTHIHYPQEALSKKLEGSAFVGFIVEKDGALTNIKLLRDPGDGFSEEALRVIKLSPKWSPGKDNEHPVRVQLVYTVKFKLPAAPPR